MTTENTPERVLAEALHSGLTPCFHRGEVGHPTWQCLSEARDLLAASPTLRDALTRGLAGSGVDKPWVVEMERARIVGRYWVRSILASESLRGTGMSHPVACVMAALDGESTPSELGVAEDSDEAAQLRAIAALPPAGCSGYDLSDRPDLAPNIVCMLPAGHTGFHQPASPPTPALTAARLAEARSRSGMTLREAAPRLGIDFTYLSKVENGHERPSDALLMRMCDLYGLEPDAVVLARAVAEVPAPVRAAIEAAALTRGLAGSGVVECICAITGPAGGGHPNINCPFHQPATPPTPALTAARLADALHSASIVARIRAAGQVPRCEDVADDILAALAGTPEEATR